MAVSSRPRRERIEPLWDRVDRNRTTLGVLVLAFVVGSALGFDAIFAIPWFFLALRASVGWPEFWAIFLSGLLWMALATGIVAAAWAAFTLLRSEKWLLKRFDAELVPTDESLDTKFALKDMALAAGFDVAPALYRIADTSTNAFIFAARHRRAVVGVTEGFTRKLSVDEQRAVFANLVARLASGDTIVSTGVTALMWPVHAWRESRLTADDSEQAAALGDADEEGRGYRNSQGSGGVLLYFLFGVGFAILAEFVAAGHRRTQLSTAEKADAEGMLLLKDPVAMLAAVKRMIELDNVVPAAGEGFAELFYCWTGVSSDDENDPEWERVARLREVLGVMGYEPEPSTPRLHDEMLPPPAPRLESAEQPRRMKDQ